MAPDRLDGTSNDIFLIFGAQTQQYRHVNQCWQVLSLLVDLLTILTVLDVCLQDLSQGGFQAVFENPPPKTR